MCFDACPTYACLPYVAARVKALTPDAKLVVMVSRCHTAEGRGWVQDTSTCFAAQLLVARFLLLQFVALESSNPHRVAAVAAVAAAAGA
jgi:hypothetical protein